MTRVFAATWIRLRHRTTLLTALGGSLLFALIPTAVIVSSASNGAQAGRPGPGPTALSVAQLERADGVMQAVASSATLLGALALALCAHLAASDYSLGTIRNLLVREPRRIRLLAGSYLAAMSLIVLAAVVATATGVATGVALAPAAGVDTSAWITGDGIRATATGLADVALTMIGYGTIGYGLGALLRSSSMSIGLGLAWLIPLESILAASVDGAERWLPGQLLNAVAHGGTASVSDAHALTLSAVVAAAVAGAAALRFRREDITA